MRFNPRTFLSSLLTAGLIYHAVSIPLQTSDPQVEGASLDLPVGTLSTSHLTPAWSVKRDDKQLITWDQALTTGRRNIAKLESQEGGQCPEAIDSYSLHYEGAASYHPKVYQTDLVKLDRWYWPEPLLHELGLAPKEQVMTKSVFSEAQTGLTLRNQKPVSQNAVSASKGILLALSNNKANDHNPSEVKIPPNEIMMQVWDELAGPDERDNLKWIIRSHITNKDTTHVIQEARKKYNWPLQSVVRLTRESNPEEFEALSGTPNCQGIYPTLANHDSGRTAGWRVTEFLIWEQGSQNDFIGMRIEQP